MRFSQPSTWAVERKLTRESWQRMKMKWNAWSFIFASCFSLIMCLVEKFWKKMLDLIHQCFFRVRKIATPGKPKDMMVVCCNVRLNDQYFLWSSFSLVEVCLHGSLAKSTISFFFFFYSPFSLPSLIWRQRLCFRFLSKNQNNRTAIKKKSTKEYTNASRS